MTKQKHSELEPPATADQPEYPGWSELSEEHGRSGAAPEPQAEHECGPEIDPLLNCSESDLVSNDEDADRGRGRGRQAEDEDAPEPKFRDVDRDVRPSRWIRSSQPYSDAVQGYVEVEMRPAYPRPGRLRWTYRVTGAQSYLHRLRDTLISVLLAMTILGGIQCLYLLVRYSILGN